MEAEEIINAQTLCSELRTVQLVQLVYTEMIIEGLRSKVV